MAFFLIVFMYHKKTPVPKDELGKAENMLKGITQVQDFHILPALVELITNFGNGFILESAYERGASSVICSTVMQHIVDFCQATRSTAIYLRAGDKFYAAIDDTADPEKNIIIARAKEGYERCRAENRFLLPVSDALVKGALRRAEKSGRIVAVHNTICSLALKTKAIDGKSEFGQNDWNKAVLLDAAEPYAQMLNWFGVDRGRVWSLTSEYDLKKMGVDGNVVAVSPVGLGYFFDSIYHSVTSYRFDEPACRAVGIQNTCDIAKDSKIVALDEVVSSEIRKQCA